jgi:hypothetical protein
MVIDAGGRRYGRRSRSRTRPKRKEPPPGAAGPQVVWTAAIGCSREAEQTLRQPARCAAAAVDIRRVSYIAEMLVAAGVESRRALPRAAFLYWAYLGQPIVMDSRHAAIPASALDEISDLFEQ